MYTDTNTLLLSFGPARLPDPEPIRALAIYSGTRDKTG